jgi:Na+/H+-dicarboxylate symporter
MLGIMGATRSKPIWFLAALLPVAQFAAIVFTANHFIFDAIIGLVVSLMGFVIAIMLQRFGYTYLRRWLGQEPAAPARQQHLALEQQNIGTVEQAREPCSLF